MASTATNIIAAATAKLASRADTQSAQPILYDEEDLPNLSSTHMLPSSDLQATGMPTLLGLRRRKLHLPAQRLSWELAPEDASCHKLMLHLLDMVFLTCLLYSR